MAYPVIMPKNGMDMKEGVLVRWLKNEGDFVAKDEPLIEIETDKITMEEPSAYEGVLLKQLVPALTKVPVLATIGYIGLPGERIDEAPASPAAAEAPKKPTQKPIPATPYAKTLASESGIELSAVIPSGRRGEIVGADVERELSMPLARRIAADEGIDLSLIKGRGFGGKITKEDARRAGATAPAGDDEVVRLSGMRKAIIRNMEEAWRIPTVTQSADADVTELLKLREAVNAGRAEKFSLNDFVLKATAKALTKHPDFLVSMGEDDTCIKHRHIHLGMAVSLGNNGLIVPVLRDADRLGLEALSLQAKELAGRARSGKLLREEYAGSTFTVTNLGMYGITSFSPILNLPNAAILGVCGVHDALALEGDKVVVRKKMGLSVTYDHRLLSGAPVAQFLVTLCELLSNPLGRIL